MAKNSFHNYRWLRIAAVGSYEYDFNKLKQDLTMENIIYKNNHLFMQL